MRRRLRIGSSLLTVAGLVHVLFAETLLWIARWGYDRVLAVDFSPREGSKRRVRLIGLLWTGAGVLLRRLVAGRQ